ncbi:MAG: diphthine synthase [Candidatus Aenigmatarchaeota archaeon]
MLTLVGIGLWNEQDLTLGGLEACKSADEVYAEFYTNIWNGDVKKIEKLIGKKIKILERSDLEENASGLITRSKKSDIALLVCGDPLVFTTHSSLVAEAKKQRIKTRIIHNASILSAIGETGLHAYKFGKSATIPMPDKISNADSVYNAIKENKTLGLHTLLLLDVDLEKKKHLKVSEAFKILSEMEKKRGEGFAAAHVEAIVFSSAGSQSPVIEYGKISALSKKKFSEPAVIIIPGMLHFSEAEFLGA